MLPLNVRNQHDSFGNAPHLLSPEDKVILDEGKMRRAAGQVICEICNKEYYDHPEVIGALWLHRLCNGELVHL